VGGNGLPNGSSCTSPDECASSFCADDTCCSTACNQACDSCAGPPSPGTCSDVCVTLAFGDNGSDDHNTAADARIREAYPSLNFGGSTSLTVDEGSTRSYALLRFGLAAIPGSATVIDATVQLYVVEPSVSPITVHRVLESWVEGAGDGNAVSGCNWIDRASGNQWTDAGCGPSASSVATSMGSITNGGTGGVYASASLSTQVVQNWVNDPSSNHGILLKLQTGEDGFDFTAREGSDGQRPTLSVRYRP
jgi:hypothetical protein